MAEKRRLSVFLEKEKYINQPNGELVNQTYIKEIHIPSARDALKEDRDSLFRNALIAYSSIFNLIQSKNYSWAFVHSYYSIVYMYQVLLAFNDISLCYDKTKAFSIKLSPGAKFEKQKGTTHECIHKLFKTEFNSDAEICSEIEGKIVCDWFEDMRNKINYRTVPQLDPDIDHGLYDYFEQDNLRKMINSYFDKLNIYAYASEHAYIAYPLLIIHRIIKLYLEKNQENKYINDAKFISLMEKNLRDRNGQISKILNLIKGKL